MAHELKAKHIQTETLENKADDRILLRNILSYIEDHSSSFEDEDVVSKRFVEERLASIGEEKYVGSIESIENVDDDITEPEEDMLVVTRDTYSLYWYDGDEWQQIGGSTETPATIKAKYESNTNTNAFTDAEKSKLAGIATGATKNANTDELSEGTNNKYFTDARAVAAKLDGYAKSETPIPLAEADSILQALGKLEGFLDTKLSIRGDNFIFTRPTSDADWNGEHLMSMYNQLTASTPGGQPLSNTNRAILIIMPGSYDEPQYGFEFYTPYIDIIGFGSKHGIILNGNVNVLYNDNHRLENLTIKGDVALPSNVDFCVYRNLTVDRFSSNGSGIFENIEHSGVGDYLFEALQDANLKNIYTPKSICDSYASNVSGILENCRSDNELGGMPLSGKLINCTLIGGIDYDGIVNVEEGAEISYSTIINNPSYPVDECYAVNASTLTNVKIHHCHFEGKTAPVGDNVINTIENGHNTWDSEGGEGIEDIIEGTNVFIDKTDPKNPVISSTGGESTTLDESFEI